MMWRAGLAVFVLLWLSTPDSAQAPSKAPAPYQARSTKEMGELLVKLFAEQDVATDPSKDAERAAALQIKLVGELPWQEELRTRWSLAENLLRAGDSAGAVKQLELIRKRCNELSVRLGPNSEQQLRDLLALSYLRLGEQENCVAAPLAELVHLSHYRLGHPHGEARGGGGGARVHGDAASAIRRTCWRGGC